MYSTPLHYISRKLIIFRLTVWIVVETGNGNDNFSIRNQCEISSLYMIHDTSLTIEPVSAFSECTLGGNTKRLDEVSFTIRRPIRGAIPTHILPSGYSTTEYCHQTTNLKDTLPPVTVAHLSGR